MTRGPRRLKDDPDFKWETGCDVRDEELLVGDYDLKGTRARLVAAIALASPSLGDAPSETGATTTVGDGIPSIRPGTARPGLPGWDWKVVLKPVAAVVTGAMVVAAAYWLGVQSGSEAEVQPQAPLEQHAAPQGAPVRSSQVLPSEPAPIGVPVGTTAPGMADADLVVSRPISSSRQGSLAKAEPGPAPVLPAEVIAAQQAAALQQLEASAPGTGESPDVVSSSGPTHTSRLPEENAAMEKANAALYEGRYSEARSAFEGYLSRFPEGRQRDEAQFGRLQAAFGAGDKEATEALARSIQDLPSLSGRRTEILRLRAESLVLLKRCDEALLLADEIPSKAGAEVRRACRRSGKESP